MTTENTQSRLQNLCLNSQTNAESLRNGSGATAIPKLVPRGRRKASTTNDDHDPPPETPPIPETVYSEDVQFTKPVRRILSPQDHQKFLDSSTYTLIKAWIFNLSDSVRGKKISSVQNEPKAIGIERLDQVLDELEALFKQYPALDTGSRFGNPAFRDFHGGVVKNQEKIHKSAFGIEDTGTIEELSG